MKLTASALALALAGFAAPAMAQQITGAGSTFAAPIYAKWGEAAKSATGIELNYQAIGSGAGQNQIFNRTVDFGASDAPVAADKLQQHHLVQFPTVMGGVDIIVNLPRHQARRAEADGRRAGPDLHGQDHEMERPQDRRAQQGREAARASPSRPSIAPTARAPPSCSPTISRWSTPTGRARSARIPR